MNTETQTEPEQLPVDDEARGSAMIGLGVVVAVAAVAGGLWWAQRDQVEVKAVDPKNVKYERPEVSPVGPWPAATVDNENHFFGSMELGDVKEHTYTVTNKGEAALVLKQGPKSCACTKYEIANKVIQPGESTTILVEWKPKEPENIFRQMMNLYTNDPERQVIQLTVEGTVASLIKILPDKEWDLGNLDEPGRAGRLEGVVATGLLDEIKITDIQTSHPQLSVDIIPAKAADVRELKAVDAVELHIAVSRDIPAGPFRGNVSFTLEGHEDRRYTINVKAHREGTVRFVGTGGVYFDKRRGLVDLGEFPASAGKQGRIMVYLSGDSQVMNAQEITTSPSFLKCTLTKDPDFNSPKKTRYILGFDVPAGSPAGGYVREQSGRVVIKTDHPEYPEIAFTVRFVALKDIDASK